MAKKEIKQTDKNIELAKQKVAELTSNILPINPPVKPVKAEQPVKITTIQDEKNVEYLTEQLDILTSSNMALEAKNEQLESDYQKIFNKYQEAINVGDVREVGNNTNNSELELKIVELYRELHDVLHGYKFGEKFETMKISVLMSKLANMFPFIRNYAK